MTLARNDLDAKVDDTARCGRRACTATRLAMAAKEVDESCSQRPQQELWRRSATAVLEGGERPSPVAWVEDALARARDTQLPGFVSCETARDDAARLQADAAARSHDVLYGLPVLVDGSLCASCWRRWGVESRLSVPIGAPEVATHPVTERLALSGAVLVGVSNASPGVGSGAVAAVACGNAALGVVVDTTRGGVLGAAAAARIVALHPTPATIPHTIDPDGEHFASLHWHATLLGRGVGDIALLYDALYTAEGWGNAGVCPPPRLSLAGCSAPEPSGPPCARSAVSQGRAAAEGGGVSPPSGFNRTAVPKTVLARQAQALPTRVAWSVELSPGDETLAKACQTAAEWFKGVGARVDRATPALCNASTLLQRCHGNECGRARCASCGLLAPRLLARLRPRIRPVPITRACPEQHLLFLRTYKQWQDVERCDGSPSASLPVRHGDTCSHGRAYLCPDRHDGLFDGGGSALTAVILVSAH